jgi:hypothetical protein
VVIGGIVKGDIFAEEKVIILSTGMIIGNIHAPRFVAEEGVILSGSCMINLDKDQAAHGTEQDGRTDRPGSAFSNGRSAANVAEPALVRQQSSGKEALGAGGSRPELSQWSG